MAMEKGRWCRQRTDKSREGVGHEIGLEWLSTVEEEELGAAPLRHEQRLTGRKRRALGPDRLSARCLAGRVASPCRPALARKGRGS